MFFGFSAKEISKADVIKKILQLQAAEMKEWEKSQHISCSHWTNTVVTWCFSIGLEEVVWLLHTHACAFIS